LAILNQHERIIAALGELPPLVADGRGGAPDRREVSARWLSGTFLTGVTSCVLMGVALFAALNGRQLLATPPEIAALTRIAANKDDETSKGIRVAMPRLGTGPLDRRRMNVSTVQRIGDRDVIKTVPFVEVNMALAANHKASRDYPPFNPLDVFAESGPVASHGGSTGLIYGAKVDSEVTLKTTDFPAGDAKDFEKSAVLSAAEAEAVVRATSGELAEGAVQVAALHYVDPQRFAPAASANPFSTGYGVRIIQQNVSVAKPMNDSDLSLGFSEELIPARAKTPIIDLMAKNGFIGDDADEYASALAKLAGDDSLVAGMALRLGVETDRENGEKLSHIVRASIYRDDRFVTGVATDDEGQLVPLDRAPEIDDRIANALRDEPLPLRSRADLPKAYDAIYRAAFSYGLTPAMTRQLLKLLAPDVDYQSRITPSDNLRVLFSNPGPDSKATDQSEILYVDARFGNSDQRYYRFQLPDGSFEYFGPKGRSARPFLLRNPVPNGHFTSGFGMRRHPILGYMRMHSGVDWGAPRGTPILAVGDGVVEKAGWAGGYGRQTVIRHANGYESSYNHQSAFANGIKVGARVRQGEVIGYVGSTGLSTGAHVHYELLVNGTPVDPMRVRLPDDKILKDSELVAFERERKRIDDVLNETGEEPVTVASQ